MSDWIRNFTGDGENRRVEVGLALTGLLFCISVGANDVFLWLEFSKHLQNQSVFSLYAALPLFNHPPPIAWLVSALYRYSEESQIPFPLLLKLPGLLGHLLSALLIYWVVRSREGERGARRSFSLYICALCPILVSAYHGNTDSLCLFFAFASAAALEERRSFFLAGLALALAINVKLIGLVLIPALASRIATRRQLLAFTAGFAPALVLFALWTWLGGWPFIEKVLFYKPPPDRWGVQLFLGLNDEFRGSGVLSRAYMQMGPPLILGSIATLSYLNFRRPRFDAYQLSAIALLLFVFLASGFGVQYMVYACPFLMVCNRSFGFAYGTVSGVFLAAVYYSYLQQWYPMVSWFGQRFEPLPATIGAVTWVLCGWLLYRLIWRSGDASAVNRIAVRE